MIRGLILGKFMPIHKGHLSMINFALTQCEELVILLCVNKKEPIPGKMRKKWLHQLFDNQNKIQIKYAVTELPNTSVSSKSVSRQWADYIRKKLPEIDIIFTSEKYGDYVAEYLKIKHIQYDCLRAKTPVSAEKIRKNPHQYWDYIPDNVQPYFVKKICIHGAESTGKSILAERLARYFNTEFVPEMARFVIGKSQDCTYNDILKIAEVHAREINNKLLKANKILICDTNLLTTKVYSQYLFHKKPKFENWIEQANKMDYYLFLDIDVPYHQDGTRLGEYTQKELHAEFRAILTEEKTEFQIINGYWQSRFLKSVEQINSLFAV